MKSKTAIALLIIALVAAPELARASCAPQPPAPVTELEGGTSSSAVSHNHGSWNRAYLLATLHNTSNGAIYAGAAREERFNSSDNAYEAGFYQRIARNLTLTGSGTVSPQHDFLPENSLSGGLELRGGDGYGAQVGYTTRNYVDQRAQIVTTGIDRYAGNSRVGFVVSLAGLTNVTGVAMSETLQAAKYLPCDTAQASLSLGRDVENTGAVNQVAVYSTRSIDLNDIHWFSPRTALNAGVGWYVLTGAYARLEVRLAIRQRL